MPNPEFKPYIRLEAKNKDFGFHNHYSYSKEGITELRKDIEFLEKILAHKEKEIKK